jgi:N-acetylmuramoyl-L-alanine amidase
LEAPECLKRRLVVLVGVVLSLGPFASLAFSNQLAKAIHQYERAQRLRAELESRPSSARRMSEYRRVILAFQQVYTLDPAYRQSPVSLAAAAALYEEMGEQVDDERYYRASIRAYQFLTNQYPRSTVSRDALFTIGEIYRSDLEQPGQAQEVFRRFLQQYPQTAKAAEARQKLRQTTQLLARRAKGRSKGTAATQEQPEADTESSASPAGAGESEAAETPHHLVRLTGVRSWVGPSYTRIVIGMEDEVKFTASRLRNPDRLVFDLSDSRLSPGLAGKSFPVEGGFLREVRVAQFQPTVTRAVLDVAKIDSYTVFSLPNPFRIIIDIHGSLPLFAERNEGPKVPQTESRLGGGETLPGDRSSFSSPKLTGRTMTPTPKANLASLRSRQASTSLGPGPAAAGLADGGSPAANLSETETAEGVAPQSKGGTLPSRTPQLGASRTQTFPGGAADEGAPAGDTSQVGRPLPASPQRTAADDPEFTYRTKPSTEGQLSQAEPDEFASSVRPAMPPLTAPGTLTRALGLKIGRIVIDPGHGGHDTGTIGPRGFCEKDLVLDVGLRLRRLIQERIGADVVMTRSNDTFIPLEERTAIANEKAADLFISIHANASRDESARGIETYYLNFTSNPQALEVAARENATSAESVHQLQSLIKKIALTEKIKESQDFAMVIQRELYARVQGVAGGQEDRGVKRAPFVVLIGANMPSILAEISFLTNSHDERLLRKPEYRQKIAEALYRGIRSYSQSVGGVRVAQRTRVPLVRSLPVHGAALGTSEGHGAIAQ